MSHFSVSPAGRALIERNEGLRLEAYQDIVGVWSIGYGDTGPDVVPGLRITKEEADHFSKHAASLLPTNQPDPGTVAGALTMEIGESRGQNDGLHDHCQFRG